MLMAVRVIVLKVIFIKSVCMTEVTVIAEVMVAVFARVTGLLLVVVIAVMIMALIRRVVVIG